MGVSQKGKALRQYCQIISTGNVAIHQELQLLSLNSSYQILNVVILVVFTHTQREIFPKSYQIKPESDCAYHALIDLGQ